MKVLALAALGFALCGCSQAQQECDYIAEINARPKTKLVPMQELDLSLRDRRIIRASCAEYEYKGDIRGRDRCVAAKVKAAVSGRIVEVSNLPPQYPRGNFLCPDASVH